MPEGVAEYAHMKPGSTTRPTIKKDKPQDPYGFPGDGGEIPKVLQQNL
jgi:hypothetical protein